MKPNRMTLNVLYLVFLALFFIVPNALAQAREVNADDIIAALGPRSGNGLVLDIFLYLIFFFGILNMFLIPDKQLTPALMNFTVIFLAVISKLLVSADINDFTAIIQPCDLPVLAINATMFAFPLIMAGMVRTKKVGNPPALYTGIITGLLGGSYFFLFWALAQRTGCDALGMV